MADQDGGKPTTARERVLARAAQHRQEREAARQRQPAAPRQAELDRQMMPSEPAPALAEAQAGETAALKERVERLEGEIAGMRLENEGLSAGLATEREKTARIAGLETKAARADLLEAQLGSGRAANAGLMGRVQQLEGVAGGLRSANADLERERGALIAGRGALQAEIGGLQDEARRLRGEADGAARQVRELEGRLRRAEEANEGLHRRKRVLEAERKFLKDANDKLNERIRDLELRAVREPEVRAEAAQPRPAAVPCESVPDDAPTRPVGAARNNGRARNGNGVPAHEDDSREAGHPSAAARESGHIGIMKTESGGLSLPRQPRTLQELIGILESFSRVGRDERSRLIAMERVPDTFEGMMREHPVSILPRYFVRLHTREGPVDYRFGGFFHDGSGHIMNTMYVTLPGGETRVSVAYESGSQATWRLLPDILFRPDGQAWYDKSPLGEDALAFPFEVQHALDCLNLVRRGENRQIPRILPQNLVLSMGQEGFEEKREGICRTMWHFSGEMGGNGMHAAERVSHDRLARFFEGLPPEMLPQFLNGHVAWGDAHSEIYGDFFRASVVSGLCRLGGSGPELQRLRYVFNVTRAGTFLAVIERADGPINKYGLGREPIAGAFPDALTIPAVEHPLNAEVLGVAMGDWVGPYRRVEGFHDRVPLLGMARTFFSGKEAELRGKGAA